MRYRIGVVSELLGLSPEGLRLYERSGILNTKRDMTAGNYRSYNLLDITALIRARTYHNYGFSLQETEKLINTDQVGTVRESYAERRESLDREIQMKKRLQDYLDSVISLIDRLPQDLDTIREGVRPGIYRFEYIHQDKLILPPEDYKQFQTWVNLTPFTFSSQRNVWSELCKGRDESISAMGILENDAAAFNIREGKNVLYHPPCRCLYTVVRLQGETVRATEYLNDLLEYVRRENIEVTGDPFARTFLSMNKRNEYTRYRQIWLPIA